MHAAAAQAAARDLEQVVRGERTELRQLRAGNACERRHKSSEGARRRSSGQIGRDCLDERERQAAIRIPSGAQMLEAREVGIEEPLVRIAHDEVHQRPL